MREEFANEQRRGQCALQAGGREQDQLNGVGRGVALVDAGRTGILKLG